MAVLVKPFSCLLKAFDRVHVDLGVCRVHEEGVHIVQGIQEAKSLHLGWSPEKKNIYTIKFRQKMVQIMNLWTNINHFGAQCIF